MRFAFWRKPRNKASVETVAARVAPQPMLSSAQPTDIDLRAIAQVLRRRRAWIIIPTLLVAALSITAANLIAPRYKSEARILIDGRENVFLRPNGERSEERGALDPEAVTSQVQLLLSRDLARDIIKKNRLAELPEFDSVLKGVSPVKAMLALFGVVRDPLRMTPEERVLDSYFDRLTVYAVDKSRVVVIEFQSGDPELAARVANSIAEGYLVLQQGARQDQARSAGQWLAGEIESLRKKVGEAESRVEDFRSKSSLFIGLNNTSLSNQQMGELNTQLNNARALKSDAESRARLIREMLQSGKPIEASEVLNSELTRRLSEQRVTLRAQLAEQSSTLLDGHPRIKELKAQLADLDRQLRDEASKISRSLDNDARIASGRVEGLTASLDGLKRQATSSNGQDVQLRALEREAKAQRDLLESYLAKFREATTRENIDAAPADGRIISRAIVSNTPAYPKKLPIVLIATLATLLLTTGFIATGELLRITAPRSMAVVAAAAPAIPREPAIVAEPVVITAPAAALPPAVIPEPEPVSPVSATQPRESHPDLAAELSEIEKLAQAFRAAGDSARKVTILGSGQKQTVTLTALTLARLLARHAKVVLVDLSASSPALAAVSNDPSAPGLADLMQGDVSFGQVITRDKMSTVHLINAGRLGSDRALLHSPRLGLALDALLRVYDHVLLDAGAASDLSAEMLTAQAQAVVVPDPSMPDDARKLMCEQLKAVGFPAVTLLSKSSPAADVTASGPQTAAA
jgi:uncharacterized protein involved in exopolysaccharide biosynthesis/Mrp family chromosome partitioning ATPase